MNIKYKSEENVIVDDNKKIKVKELFKDKIENNKKIIACISNNEVKSLDYEVKNNDKVELLGIYSKDGRRIYIRGLLYIMSKAFNELYPEALLSVNYQLSNSMYCEVDNMNVTEEMIHNVDKKMREIVSKDLEIRKVEMTKEEAEEFYEKEKT